MPTSSPRTRLPRALIYNTKGSFESSSRKFFYTHHLRHPFSHTIILRCDRACFFPADLGPFALISRIRIGGNTNNAALVLVHCTKKESLDNIFVVSSFWFTATYIPHRKFWFFFFLSADLNLKWNPFWSWMYHYPIVHASSPEMLLHSQLLHAWRRLE